MKDVQIHINDDGHGAFVILENGTQVGLMEVEIEEGNLTVLRTDVSKKLREQGITLNQGIGSKLIDAVVSYAREHELKVIPFCSYVHQYFRYHKELYKDVWNRQWPFVT